MAMININKLTFYYDGSYDNIFEDVSFQMDTDWKLGFIGRNGRGKTTFLKLLLGRLKYRGSIYSPVCFEYFPYEVADENEIALDIAQNICACEEWQLRKEFSMLEVEDGVMYQPFFTLSGGEKTKLLLAALFLKENSFLLIDEPTNHLDSAARAVVGNYLKSKKGFILVSHDRQLLDDCIDHVLSINKANIEIQKGNFFSWDENRRRQDEFEIGENEKLKRDITRLEAAAKQSANWSDKVEKTKHGQRVAGLRPDRGNIGHKAAKMMKRSKVTEARRDYAATEKSKLLKNIEQVEGLFFQTQKYFADILLEAKDLGVRYGERQIFDGFDITLRQGERILLKGKNGSGKTTLLRLFAGDEIAHTGLLSIGSRLKVSYLSQDTSFLRGSIDGFAKESEIDESLFKAILRKLDFERRQFEKNMEELSGGQKKKILIARSLCQQANLYIWDEPLNFVDIISRMQIERAIIDSKPTMIFTEHDVAFAKQTATRLVEV